MKTINKYINEVTGREYRDKNKCIEQEKIDKDIQNAFSFYVHPKGKSCEFENGCWCVERGYDFYQKFVKTLIDCIKKYEPDIVKKFKDEKLELTEEYVRGYYIGRMLSDGDNYLYHYCSILSSMCKTCYKEYGQPFFANHCMHDGTVDHHEKGDSYHRIEKVPSRNLKGK